jgi:hypothetical protein
VEAGKAKSVVLAPGEALVLHHNIAGQRSEQEGACFSKEATPEILINQSMNET